MCLPLHAKTYAVFLVFCFKVCDLYSYDQNTGLKVLEVLGTSGAVAGRCPKEREKVSCSEEGRRR